MSEQQKSVPADHPLLKGKSLGEDAKQFLDVLQAEIILDEKVISTLCRSSEDPTIQSISSINDINNLFVEARSSLDIDTMKACISVLKRYSEKFGEIQEEGIVKDVIQENDIDEINDAFLSLPEDMRLLVAKQLGKERRYNFGCGGSFGYYKTPTGCGGCISGKESLELAQLNHLVEFRGSRQYSIPKERISQAQKNILSESSQLTEKNQENISKMQEMYTKQLRICESIIKNKSAIEEIQKTNPSLSDQFIVDNLSGFLTHMQGIKDCRSITIDPESCVVAYIQGTSRYSGSGGCEYGNYVVAWYNDTREATHVVFRDAYNSSKDNRDLSFDSVSIDSIQETDSELSVSLSAKSKGASRKYSFEFPLEKKDLSDQLDEDEQEAFSEIFDTAKEDILLEKKKKYSEKTMPFYCLPNESQFQGMPTNDLPYQTPQIMSSSLDKLHGKGVVVVKSQIDHSAGAHKMQREWEVFLVEHNKQIQSLQRECRWYNEIQGGRTISLDADDILQKLL